MELTRESILSELRQRAVHFRAQGILGMALFGSFARGDATENSDIDVLVDLDETEPSGLVLFGKLQSCQQELQAIFGRPVDVIPGPLRPGRVATRVNAEQIRAY